MPLTDYPLYELEQYAKRKGYDIDRLRQDYWDEMLSTGKAGREGSVRQQALKSRVFDVPVDELEPLPPIEYQPPEAPPEQARTETAGHLKQLAGSLLGSLPEAWGQAAKVGLAGGSQLRGIPPIMGTEAGDLIPKVSAAQKAAEEALAQAGLGQKLPEPDWEQNKIKAAAQMLEKMLAESAGYMTLPGIGQAGRALSPASKLGQAGIEALGFGGLTGGAQIAEGVPPEQALEEAAMTGAGIMGLHGLGAAVGKAAKGVKKAYAGAFRGAPKAVEPKVETPVTPPPEVPPVAAPPDLKNLADDELTAALFEQMMSGEDVAPIRAEIARRTAPPPVETPAPEIPKTPEQRTVAMSDLIEAQNAEAEAARAARMGITPEELAAQDAVAQRAELTAAAKEFGVEPPGAPPPVEPPAVAPLNLVRYGYEGGEKIDYRGGDFYLTKERMDMHPEGKGGFEQYGKRIETQFTPKNPLVVEISTEETIGPTVLSKLIGRDKADTFLRNWYENPELAAQQLRELGVSEQQIKNLQKYSESGRLDAQHRFAPSEAAAIQAAKNSGYDSIIYTQKANSTNPTNIESVIVLNKAKVEPPAVAPQAPQTGVPTEGVPPGREGERGFVKTELLTGKEGERSGIPARVVAFRVPKEKIEKENFLRDLGREYLPEGSSLYRETNIGHAQDVLPFSNTFTETSADNLFVSNRPELALGQGKNRGVLIEFDPAGLQGQVATNKPTWGLQWDQGNAEFVVKYAKQHELRKAVRSFTIKRDAKVDVRSDALAMKRIIDSAEKAGWVKTVAEDGSITMTRPTPGGREGERGFINLGTLFPSLGKAQQAQQQTAAAAAASGAKTVLSPRLQQGIDGIESRLGILADKMSKRVGELGFENADEAAKFGEMMLNTADDISLRGWTAKERAQRRELKPAAGRSQTWNLAVSERDISEWGMVLQNLSKELETLNRNSIAETGVSLKEMGGQQLYDLLGRMARSNDILRTAAGRTLASARQAAAVQAAIAKQLGLNLNGLKVAMSAERDPIYTKIVQAAKDFRSAKTGEDRTRAAKEFGSNLTDAWRMNLFTVGSWTLDMIGNLVSTAIEAPGIVAEDITRALRGDISLASTSGALRAGLVDPVKGAWQLITKRRLDRRVPLAVEQSLGMSTAGGERVGGKLLSTGKGAFTRGVVPGRSAARNTFSVAVDKIAGAPLYAKAAFDTGFKRLGAMAAIYRDATLRANSALKSGKISAAEYDGYVKRLVQNPDSQMVESATQLANKLGFNRPLYQAAETLAKNPLYKLFGAAFGRWPFQMTAALAEWIGMNPGAWKAAYQSGRPGALVGQLAKAATGIGGLALLNKSGMYERMDWKTMEYVQEDGDRVRIGGREPLATAMTLLTMQRQDEKAFLDSLRFSSIPFAGLISGEGGLLSSVVTKLNQAQERRDLDPKALSKEASRLMAKMIPGQALLAALKVAFDPVAREQNFPAGVVAELPGISKALPPQIDPTTGQPREPTQRILGGPEIPAAGGVVIPGAERTLAPVHQLLSAYGLMNYKMPRRPLPIMGEGIDPKMNPEWQSKWYQLYGAERAKMLGDIAPQMLEKRKDVPFGLRVRLLDDIKNFNKATRAGMSAEEVGQKIWGKDWQKQLQLARELESDLKIINKRDKAAMDAAFIKLTREMRRARREGRQ